MIIDIHGHYTTAPKALEAWRNQQIAGITDPSARPRASDLRISDDELRETIEANQLAQMRARGSDLTIFSPRASFMAHHIGDFAVSSAWAAICNELCFRVSRLFPDHFVPAAMLPQSPGVAPETCIPELETCVREYGAVAVNLNPDPSGGHWTSPPLTDRHWYPIYEKLVEHDLPAMIHVSTSCNPCFHTTGAHYINADTTAFMQLIQGDLFRDFPTLRFVIPHGGGAAPYHWGRYRGLAQELKKPLLKDHLLNNVFFDTCVYHQPGIDLLTTGRADREHPVRERDDRRGARRRPRDRPQLRRHQALRRGVAQLTPAQRARSTKATPGASTRASTPRSRRKGSDMYEIGVVYRNIQRADEDVAGKLAAFGTATVHEAMGRVGLMTPNMRPIYPGAQVSGTAVTVLLQPGDNWMLHVAAEQIRPGDVVVAAVTAACTDGFFGELLATSFKARGARALVIDGGCRDVKALTTLGFPSGAARSAPRAPSRRRSAR